jgi:D-serine deaminase-like pyridoxal phosphate-dependent protein
LRYTGLDEAVAGLRRRAIGPVEKGFGCVAPVTAEELAARRPGLFDGEFTLPLAVLRDSALEQNVAEMARYCAAAGVDLAPHGKTTMAPQLFARQLAAGAWAVTAATIGHVQAYRAFGVPRILLANELTDPAGLGWLAAEMAADPGFDCDVYADSVDGVRLLGEAFGASGPQRPLPVLVELGFPGGRTGSRTVADAMAVAEAVGSAPSLRLAGAAGYEGGIGHDRGPATLDAVAGFCRDLRTLGERVRELAPGPGEVIVTAGGSVFFDVVAAELTAAGSRETGLRVVLRSGAYITHDHGVYAGLTPGGAGAEGLHADSALSGAGVGAAGAAPPKLTPAFELWAPVLSRPEPELAVLCAGRRDASFDAGMPVPLRVRGRGGQQAGAAGMLVTRLDDQHAYLTVPPGSGLAPGDLVGLGISHPCTMFDKWRVIPVVDEDYRVVDAVHTFF